MPALSAAQLRHVCDPAQFAFRTTDELPSLDEVIGQERALQALAFGIDITNHGYHLYALGPAGTGKTTTIRKYLEREAAKRLVPDDWIYLNNFGDPDKPRALRLPAGVGSALLADMDHLVEELSSEVPRVFEGTEYNRAEEQLGSELQARHQALMQEAEDTARSKGFALVQTPQGLLIAPVVNGTVLSPDEQQALDEHTRQQLSEGQTEVERTVRDVMRRMAQLGREARERKLSLDRDTIRASVGHLLDELRERYAAHPVIVAHLDAIQADILENVGAFKQIRQLEQMQSEPSPFAALLGKQMPTFDMYKVNLLVDNSHTQGAPVILVRNPSYHNLLGRIEHQGQFGTLVTNFSLIRAGLLHKANGGYLLLDVRDVLTKPLAYEGLKRALKNHMVEIESLAEMYGLFATRTLEPEPIPLHIKVILIGDPQIYYLLHTLDPDFQELFKVKVDFSVRMDRTPESTVQYARFIATVCREEGLPHFDPGGVARVVEHGSRLVNDQARLVTKFGDIVDLIRQATYWAKQHGGDVVTAADVQRAIDAKVYRANHIQQLIEEAIQQGVLYIDTAGAVPGQINGIAVLSPGDYAFGKPSRITARAAVGSKGVMNIDREVKLGGRIHNKGAMILAGYLAGKFADQVPLALDATITFEQEYEEIEGDSASSAELYALLSALSGFPIRQELAVTGSVNQHGQVQPIGGVNEKIEGFFDTCVRKGLSGTQGVVIPASNVQHLMLRADVVGAVQEGRFHVYAVDTIDDGIALLTGQSADAVNSAARRTLHDLAGRVRAFLQPDERGEDDAE
jgi:lon-related putative ATP-dependent protease